MLVHNFMESITEKKATESFSWDPRHTYSVCYHGGPKLSSLESQEQGNPSRWYSLLSLVQISANVYYFPWHFPFSHSKGGWGWGCLDLFLNSSSGGAETHWDLENAGPGLYKTLSAPALSHLCLSLALGVCEKVMVMVLLGQSGFWDASLTLRPKSISDHFNALEHGGLLALPASHKFSPAWRLTPTL